MTKGGNDHCAICARPIGTPAGCWREFEPIDTPDSLDCYRLGFKRLVALEGAVREARTWMWHYFPQPELTPLLAQIDSLLPKVQ